MKLRLWEEEQEMEGERGQYRWQKVTGSSGAGLGFNLFLVKVGNGIILWPGAGHWTSLKLLTTLTMFVTITVAFLACRWSWDLVWKSSNSVPPAEHAQQMYGYYKTKAQTEAYWRVSDGRGTEMRPETRIIFSWCFMTEDEFQCRPPIRGHLARGDIFGGYNLGIEE